MLSPEQRSHYVMLSRFGSARSLRLRTFVFAMVLLAGDAIPEPPCSGPGLQLLEAVCSCPGYCAHPMSRVLAAEVELQWQQVPAECFKMRLLVSESSGSVQMSKLCLRTQYRCLAGSAYQEPPAPPRLSIASMCS